MTRNVGYSLVSIFGTLISFALWSGPAEARPLERAGSVGIAVSGDRTPPVSGAVHARSISDAGRLEAGLPNEFSGSYGFRYTWLNGNLELCSGIMAYQLCVPVDVSVPLEDGLVTDEAIVDVLYQYLEVLYEEAYVPEVLLDTLVATLEATFIPVLVSEINAQLVYLPYRMDLWQSLLEPTRFAVAMESGREELMFGAGELVIETGAFDMVPALVSGHIDREDGYRGVGVTELPVQFGYRIEVPVPWGDGAEEVWVSAVGTLRADFNLARE